jgi:hypothetical protein
MLLHTMLLNNAATRGRNSSLRPIISGNRNLILITEVIRYLTTNPKNGLTIRALR